MRMTFWSLLTATALFSPAQIASAQVSRNELQSLKAQVEQLNRRIAELETIAIAGETASPADADAEPVEPALPDAEATAAAAPIIPLQPGEQRFARDEFGHVEIPSAPLDRALQSTGAAFQVSASSGSGEVAIKLGRTVSDPRLRGGKEGWGTYTTWTATASAPLSTSGSTTDIGTLDAFTNSSKLKVKWSQFRTRLRNPLKTSRWPEIVAVARERCLQKAGKVKDLVKACNETVVRHELVQENAPELYDEYLRLGFPPSWAMGYGIEGTIGYKKFKFLDPATVARDEQEKFPLGAKAFFSLLPPDGLQAVTFAAEYQRGYKEKDGVVICPATTGTTPTQCLTGPGGAPTLNEKLLGSIEYRRLFDLGEGGILNSIGASIQVTYDALNNDFGIDLPIYLAPNDKGQLTGGIRFGFTTKENDFLVGIFVGSAFSLF